MNPNERIMTSSGIHKRFITLSAGFLCILTAMPFMIDPAFAHKGHGNEEIGEYDLDTPRQVSPETAKHIGIKTGEVDIQPIEEVIELSGTVKPFPDKQYSIVSLIEGQVSSIAVQIGDTVNKGDILIEMESLPYLKKTSSIKTLDAQIKALEFGKKAAEEELTRTENLAGEAVPMREIASRKAELAKIESELNLARIEMQQLESWIRAIAPITGKVQKPLSYFTIKAPASGVVVHRHVMTGQWVKAGEVMLEVADYSSVQIEGELPESLVVRLEKAKANKVRIRIPSDPSYLSEGTLKYLAPELDPVKRTIHLIVNVPNTDGALRGEMWVDLAVILREVKSALVVPHSSVVVQGPMHFVFIENGGKYYKQDIVPGVTDDRFVEVKDGLAPGDIVVVEGAYSLTQLKSKGKYTQKGSAEKLSQER